MPNPKKITIGSAVPKFPAGTWNALVDDYWKRQGAARPQGPASFSEARSPFLVRLVWDGAASLPPGNVVKLDGALVEPADNASAPFLGLQFFCTTPGSGDAQEPVAITLAPIEEEGMGFGHLAGAVWARVNVTNAAHDYANVNASTILQSTASGRFRIIEKEGGTGEKWAVVLLDEFASGTYHVIKGTSPGVTRSDSTFTLGSPVAVQGDLPSGTITVTCDPKIYCPNGSTVYARYDITKHASDDLQRWSTADAGNDEWIHKGYPQFDPAKKQLFTADTDTIEWNEIATVLNWLAGYTSGNLQSIGHDASSDTEWQDDSDACP